MRTSLLPEKIATICHMAAFSLAWFLGLDIAGVDPELALLTWAAVAPAVLYPLLTRLMRAATRRTEEITCPQRTQAVLNYLRGQVEPSVRTILDCCGRLDARSREPQEQWRVVQEAATIHSEAIRLRDALCRSLPAGAGQSGDEGDVSAPRQDRRAIRGYVRRASGVANPGPRS